MKLFVALVLSYGLVVQVRTQERDFTEIIELSQELGPGRGRCDPKFSLEDLQKGRPIELRGTQRRKLDQNCYKLDSILNNADNIMSNCLSPKEKDKVKAAALRTLLPSLGGALHQILIGRRRL